ncbi:MAG: hypothetical protein ACR2NU_04545 [Aeoliella sp.]
MCKQWRWLAAIGWFALMATEATAQSGSRTQPRYAEPAQPTRAAAPAPAASGSRSKPAASGAKEDEHPVGLRGYCPVCLLEMRNWRKGNEQFSMQYDGKLYYFPEQKQLEMFRENPVKYVPKLGGDCPVHFAQTGERVAGDLRLGVVQNGRLVFLASDQHRQAFHAAPSAYENVDLAHGGECVVCRVDGNMRSPGQEQLVLLYHGMRYHFASGDHLNAFARDPGKYSESPGGSATREGGSRSAGAAPNLPRRTSPTPSAGSGSSGR